jgi:hypothetical protein
MAFVAGLWFIQVANRRILTENYISCTKEMKLLTQSSNISFSSLKRQ